MSFAGDSNFQMRKIATKHLKTVITNVKESHPVLAKIISNLLNDREDLIKMMALEGAVKYFPENPITVLDSLRNMLTLNSWRINMKVCEELPELLQQTTKQQFRTYIEQAYMKFLTHEEPELRAAACTCLEAVCQSMEVSDIVRLIIPAIQKLSIDVKPFVRGTIKYNSVEVAKKFLSLSQFIPKQFTSDMLLPLMAGFLKDPDPNTSLAVFSSLPILFNNVPSQQLEETTLQCINQLLSSNNWRTKCRAIEIMSEFIKFPAFLNDRIVNIIIGWTFDKIDAVRMKAISLL
jgi:serine/threonine-protein phosphatase 2A regulatory subunit A